MTEPGQIQVRGGVGGVSALLAEVERVGGVLRVLADRLAEFGRTVTGVCTDPGLLATGLQSPTTFAQAQAELIKLRSGREGLVLTAARIELLGASAITVAAAYRSADAAAAGLLRATALLSGHLAGVVTRPLLPFVGVAAVMLRNREATSVTRSTSPAIPLGERTLRLLARHPWAGETLVAAVPGLVGGVSGGCLASSRLPPRARRLVCPTSMPEVAMGVQALGGLGGLATGGQPWFRETGRVQIGVGPTRERRPAGRVGALLDRIPADQAGPSRIHVERIDTTGARRSWVVSIPGTSAWSPVAGPAALDLTGDLRLMAGQRSAGTAAVVAALRSAGARPGEPVLLVGHSQGGMIAAAVAADPTLSRDFTITHLLTSGAPIASVPIPKHVQVLSLEHTDDLIVRLEGSPNPDRPSWVTVSTSAPVTDLPAADRAEPLVAHRSGLYRRTAARLDTATHPSIVTARNELAPFLDAPDRSSLGWEVAFTRVGTS